MCMFPLYVITGGLKTGVEGIEVIGHAVYGAGDAGSACVVCDVL